MTIARERTPPPLARSPILILTMSHPRSLLSIADRTSRGRVAIALDPAKSVVQCDSAWGLSADRRPTMTPSASQNLQELQNARQPYLGSMFGADRRSTAAPNNSESCAVIRSRRDQRKLSHRPASDCRAGTKKPAPHVARTGFSDRKERSTDINRGPIERQLQHKSAATVRRGLWP